MASTRAGSRGRKGMGMKHVKLTYEMFEDRGGGLFPFAIDPDGTVVWGFCHIGPGDTWDREAVEDAASEWSDFIDFRIDPRESELIGFNPKSLDSAHATCGAMARLIASSAWESGLPYGIDVDACGAAGLLFAELVGAVKQCPACGFYARARIDACGLIEHPTKCPVCNRALMRGCGDTAKAGGDS